MDALETGRLRLEPWDRRYEEDFVRLAADPRVMRHIAEGRPWDRERASRRFDRILEHWREHGFGWRSVIEKASGAWLGFEALNYLGPGMEGLDESEIEIGWWLAPQAWGRGIATEGARAVRDEAFGRLGAERIVGRYAPENTASGRVMEKLGMTWHRDTVGPQGQPVRVYVLDRPTWQKTRP